LELLRHFESIANEQPLLALLLAFVGGVLAGFTPCAYPMIPITVGFIGSKAGNSRWRGFVLSSIYVLGVATIYSGLGAFAALTGQMFGASTTNQWTYLAVANICLFFGLVMLEAIPISTPAFLSGLQVRRLPGNDMITSFLMGGASALVISSCTTPILGVMLTIVATGQKVFWGMAMLFVFAYGMGALVICVGTFTGLLASIPRSGIWMKRIQKGFGILMIIVGEYFLIKSGELWI
jgi:thiol:disulfide interchange protein DsbD